MDMVIRVASTVGIAAAIVLVGHLLEWALGARRERRLYLDVASAAVATMATVAFLDEVIVPDFPPSNGTLWIFWLAPEVAFVAGVNAIVRKPVVAWPLRIIVAAGGIYLAASPLLEGAWAEGGLTKIGLATLATLLLWFGVQRLVDRDPEDPSTAFGLAFAAAGGAGAIAFVSSIKLGLAPAAVAMGMGATAILMVVTSGRTMRAMTDFYAPMTGMMYTMAYGYADFAALPMLLVGAAPLLAWAGVAVADRAVWVRIAVRVVAVLVPVAVATPLAERALTETDEEQQVDEDGSYRPY